MSFTLGMIAALPELGPHWLFRATSRLVDIVRTASDADRFDDGYDLVTDSLTSRGRP